MTSATYKVYYTRKAPLVCLECRPCGHAADRIRLGLRSGGLSARMQSIRSLQYRCRQIDRFDRNVYIYLEINTDTDIDIDTHIDIDVDIDVDADRHRYRYIYRYRKNVCMYVCMYVGASTNTICNPSSSLLLP